jgi:hypothetical protein
VAKVEELAQLKDIHLPEAISWWPLAPGWYGLMLLIVCLVISLVYMAHKRAMYSRPKKQALALLATYKQAYERDCNAQLTSARISELLKRVALVYYPRAEVAGLQGMSWVDFLNTTSKKLDFKPIANMLLESPFKLGETVQLNPLISKAELWIKQRKKPCSN